ncbi:MAG: DUF177 domain-containing protein [Bacteroidetes bacterium]|nr:DUF177 domain-containing protein [Bacteroidota bacterium]
MVEALKKYRIDIFNLSHGEHEFDFEFTDDFFTHYGSSIIKKGSGNIKVIITKSETLLELGFNITGSIELVCDRSLDLFNFPISIHKNLIMKFGDEDDADYTGMDITNIPWKTESINVGQLIYEFVGLEVPIKKLHPRYMDQVNDNSEDELIYASSQTPEERDKSVQKIDPRWEKLQQILSDKNNTKNKI